MNGFAVNYQVFTLNNFNLGPSCISSLHTVYNQRIHHREYHIGIIFMVNNIGSVLAYYVCIVSLLHNLQTYNAISDKCYLQHNLAFTELGRFYVQGFPWRTQIS